MTIPRTRLNLDQERIYTSIDLYSSKGFRGQLRVFYTPWRGFPKIHVREFHPNRVGGYDPGRGYAMNPDTLESVIFALVMAREDLIEAGVSMERPWHPDDESPKNDGEESLPQQEPTRQADGTDPGTE